MTMTQLNLKRLNDLPPSWDGVPITWGEWNEQNAFICPPPPIEERACKECGTVSESSLMNVGTRPRDGVEYVPSIKPGRSVGTLQAVPAWPLRDIIAYRCAHCGHDYVWDQRTDEWWDLDIEDYEDDGSRPSDVLF